MVRSAYRCVIRFRYQALELLLVGNFKYGRARRIKALGEGRRQQTKARSERCGGVGNEYHDGR